MATGDILSVTIRPDGWSADVVFDGLAAGGTYANGFGANNNPATGTPRFVLNLTSQGFDASGNATTRPRTIYGTKCVRKTTPDNGQLDETFAAGQLTARISLSQGVFQGDTAITASVLSGFLTSGGTPNNARASFAVTSNSTLPYPKVVGRWEWPCFERVTGDFLAEMWCFHPYAMNGSPVACVKFDATDESANTSATQTSTAMVISDRGGDVIPVPVYKAIIPVANLTQGHVLSVNFRAYPWIGDAAACLDSRTTADGVAAPNVALTPLMAYLDKANSRACYASVDGVGASGACSLTKSGARATPFASIAAALTALKAFNLANHADNSLNNCVVLMQNGVYTGSTSFTGSNTKSWCEIVGDLENGATEAGVVISTAANTGFNGYFKLKDLTLSGAGTGLLKGATATTASLWLDSITTNCSSASWIYAWGGGIADTRNTHLGTSPQKHFGANPGPWYMHRGSSNANPTQTHAYNIIGCTNLALVFQETGNAAGHGISDGIVWAHSTIKNTTMQVAGFASATNVLKGIAIVGVVAERINTDTQPLIQVSADGNTAAIVNNVYIAHSDLMGARSNICYQDAGTTTFTRLNWFDQFNLFEQFNIKTDTFGTPNANRVGNWAMLYGVNTEGSRSQTQLTFNREFDGLNTLRNVGDFGFVNDASYTGSNAGNGDYHLAEASLAKNLASFVVTLFDLDGNARTAPDAAGAYRQTPAVSAAFTGNFFACF